MAQTTVILTNVAAPVSDGFASIRLPTARKTVVGATFIGESIPGPGHVGSWITHKPPGLLERDELSLPILPDIMGLSLEPSLSDELVPMCVPVPDGYDTLYSQICNPSLDTVVITHVLRISF